MVTHRMKRGGIVLISGELYSSYSAVGNFRCKDKMWLWQSQQINGKQQNDLETVIISYSGWKNKTQKNG